MERLKRRKSTRKQSKLSSLMILVVVVVVCAVSVIKITDLKAKSKELSETEKILEYRIEQANLERENLVAQEQYMMTNQYIEDVAKDKFGLVYPDEIVIRPAE
ncbi:MAG: cell division protein FtsL [Wujia sp.]